ncbi:MAG: hypothetical protein ACQES9_04925 [Myxococcota bacterium]
MRNFCIFCILLFAIACSQSRIYTPSASFDSTGGREINDEDKKKAYEAKPQIISPSRLAYYNLTRKEKNFEQELSQLENIKSTYKIPFILIEGINAENNNSYHNRRFEKKEAISIKKLRLLGARAHADLLLVYSTTAKTEISVNPWIVSSVFLITPLFIPMYDLKVVLTMNVWLLDIRNGYLYKEISLTRCGQKKYLNIWNMDEGENKIVSYLEKKIFPQVVKELNKVLQ